MLSVERGRKRTLLGMAASNNSRCDGNELCLGMVLRSIKGWYPLGFFSACRNTSHILIRDVEMLLRITSPFLPVPTAYIHGRCWRCLHVWTITFELSGDMFKCCLSARFCTWSFTCLKAQNLSFLFFNTIVPQFLETT